MRRNWNCGIAWFVSLHCKTITKKEPARHTSGNIRLVALPLHLCIHILQRLLDKLAFVNLWTCCKQVCARAESGLACAKPRATVGRAMDVPSFHGPLYVTTFLSVSCSSTRRSSCAGRDSRSRRHAKIAMFSVVLHSEIEKGKKTYFYLLCFMKTKKPTCTTIMSGGTSSPVSDMTELITLIYTS